LNILLLLGAVAVAAQIAVMVVAVAVLVDLRQPPGLLFHLALQLR
jgi:hypothetical protein